MVPPQTGASFDIFGDAQTPEDSIRRSCTQDRGARFAACPGLLLCEPPCLPAPSSVFLFLFKITLAAYFL